MSLMPGDNICILLPYGIIIPYVKGLFKRSGAFMLRIVVFNKNGKSVLCIVPILFVLKKY